MERVFRLTPLILGEITVGHFEAEIEIGLESAIDDIREDAEAFCGKVGAALDGSRAYP